MSQPDPKHSLQPTPVNGPPIRPAETSLARSEEERRADLRHSVRATIAAVMRARRSAGVAAIFAEEAQDFAREIDDPAADELGAVIDSMGDVKAWLDDARDGLDSLRESLGIEEGCATIADAWGEEEDDGEDDDGGYLAVGPSTSDRAIEGLITAVGADRVFSIFDRLTAPANTTNADA